VSWRAIVNKDDFMTNQLLKIGLLSVLLLLATSLVAMAATTDTTNVTVSVPSLVDVQLKDSNSLGSADLTNVSFTISATDLDNTANAQSQHGWIWTATNDDNYLINVHRNGWNLSTSMTLWLKFGNPGVDGSEVTVAGFDGPTISGAGFQRLQWRLKNLSWTTVPPGTYSDTVTFTLVPN